MRPSSLEERLSFYTQEFDVSAVSRWIGGRGHSMKFAMIPGRHTGIVAPAHAENKDDVVIVDTWTTAADIRDFALEYLPEGLYYDRNRYFDVQVCAGCDETKPRCDKCYNYCGQQLAFDLDPENIDCPYHGHIGKKIQRGRGLSFCMYEFKAVRRQAIELRMELDDIYNEVSIVFSGRGFHVVVDDESAYSLSRKERQSIARRYGRRYAIDEWVTVGGSRLMRLPCSLNGLVSRKCITVKEIRDMLGFDPRSSKLVLPAFLKSA
jgi:DNA primase catalytic subunit